MAAISDSSALILLGRAGRLGLLRSLFTEILIPPAVRREVTLTGAGRAGAEESAAAGWITVRAPANPSLAARPFGAIGAGETEAIALALELGWNEPILLDDLAARRVAERQGLLVTGCGGVLVLAKDHGLIPSVAPLLDLLRASGLYLSESTYRRILATAGESRQAASQDDV